MLLYDIFLRLMHRKGVGFISRYGGGWGSFGSKLRQHYDGTDNIQSKVFI